VDEVDLKFIQDNAKSILAATTVLYIKTAVPRRILFQNEPEAGVISSVYTAFFVDHDEPLRALEVFKLREEWCMGELLDGHEFLLLLPVAPEAVLFSHEGEGAQLSPVESLTASAALLST
jgi:hypothetical protein